MKFINMIRNPDDTFSSYVNQVWFPSSIPVAAKVVSAKLNKTDNLLKRIPPDSTMTVRLEDLVTNAEETLTKVSKFLGIDNYFNLSLLGSETANIGRAEENSDIKNIVNQLLGDWKERHGYL
jgi:hypothetical protein